MFSFLNLEMAGLCHRHTIAHPRRLRPKTLRLTSCWERCTERSGCSRQRVGAPRTFRWLIQRGGLARSPSRASTGNGAGALAVLGRTAPHFPLGLALFHQRNKNGTWDIITLAELAAEKCLCLLKCAQDEISALPLAPSPLARGRFLIMTCVFIIKGVFSGRFGSRLVQIPK